MDGVPGELIAAPMGLVFGSRMKASPYDSLLDQLASAPPGQVLRFGDVRAKPSIYNRAKKKGYLITFAESAGQLYVKFAGRVDDDVKASRREKIRFALRKFGAMSHIKIANKLREGGDELVDASLIDTILLQMHKAGEVVRTEGDAWGINPLWKPPLAKAS